MNRRTAPSRILMTADAIGGVWTFALELADALGQHGCEVVLATMGARPNTCQRREANELENVVLVESEFRLEWMNDPWSDVDRAADWLRSLNQQYNPGLVHLNGYSHADLPWNVPVVITAHSCVWSWWRAVKREDPPKAYDEYRKRVQRGLRAAHVVAAPTRAMLEELQGIYGYVNNPTVVPNVRALQSFYAESKRPLIMSAGRAWDEAKNLSALAAVAPKLTWPIEIAGSCEHPNGTNVGLTGVSCLGRLDSTALAERLSRAAIFALPARYEPFGLSVLEAALSGCALVLGDIPSLRETWGNTAVYVDPDDHEQLGRTLNELANDQWYRSGLAHRASVRAREIAGRDMVSRYLTSYRQCLERDPHEVAA